MVWKRSATSTSRSSGTLKSCARPYKQKKTVSFVNVIVVFCLNFCSIFVLTCWSFVVCCQAWEENPSVSMTVGAPVEAF